MKKVFISAGHGGTDSGAFANNTAEASVVLEFRDMVAFYLEREGVQFSMDGGKTFNMPLKEAIKLFTKDHVTVEFHLNAGPPQATGVETLSDAKHFSFCNRLVEAISSVLKIRNRGVKPEGSGQHSRLAFVQAGGVIVELFFLTNINDLNAYQEKKWVLAREIARVLIKEAKG